MRLRPTTASLSLLAACLLLAACRSAPTPSPDFRDARLPVEARVEALLSQMTLEEKIGQMTQVEKNSLRPADITTRFIGSVLSGGGGYPPNNTPQGWAEMVNGFQERALQTRLGIPLLYGVDAVHGHGNLYGATLFPHNIGLGATHDPDLVERIGRATAEEMTATGIFWNFGPVVAVPQDIRWGRTYEGFSENTELVSTLASAYIRGLQNDSARMVLATAKHFVGDGGTSWGSSTTGDYKLDQGVTDVDEAALRAIHLPPYQAAIEAGAQSIMVSFSSWGGLKMHAQKHLLTDVLKGELGFQGFLISDWGGIDQIPGDYHSDVVTSINAGLDMIMVPYDYDLFIRELTAAVNAGEVPVERVDDAVRRILTVKIQLGLFEQPFASTEALATVRSEAHLALAREAVRKSLVLLKNDHQALPIAKDAPLIFVAGGAADDLGVQSGGWTIEWQGIRGNRIPGTTVLHGIQAAVADSAAVHFDRDGKFDDIKGPSGDPAIADVGIVVVGEAPYSEGVGDRDDLVLPEMDVVERVRARSTKTVLIVISGRPLILTGLLGEIDALVAAWLPGTEGEGVADVLFGDYGFTGRLPYSWPRTVEQIPFDFGQLPASGCDAPLFPYGYGLDANSPVLVDMPDCP